MMDDADPEPTAVDKRSWRSWARRRRQDLVVDSGRYCATLTAFLDREVPAGQWVVVYDAMADEVDLGPLLHAHPDPAGRYAVTRTPDEGFTLTLHPWGGPSEQHSYGYRQPTGDSPTIDDDLVGAVLVPGLVFSRAGARLGRGKGYYDRLLARLGDAMRVGVTGGLVVDELPADDHDVPMTHLAYADRVDAVGCDPVENPGL